MEVVLVGGLADGKRVAVMEGCRHINVAVSRNPLPVVLRAESCNIHDFTWEVAEYSARPFGGRDGDSIDLWVSTDTSEVNALRVLLSRHPPTSADGDYETKNQILNDMA